MSSLLAFDGSALSWIVFGALAAACLATLQAGLRQGLHVLTTLAGLGIAALTLWASPGLAQHADTELRALVEGVEQSARSAEAALRDWTAEVAQRRPAYLEEAETLARGNSDRLREGLRMVDDPAFARLARELDEAMGAGAAPQGAAYVAVSLSMPPETLRALALDAQKAGVTVVIRGLVDGSFEETLKAVKAAFDDKTAAGVAIDPQVFRTYGIKAVPTFVVADRPFEPCYGLDCVAPAPPHDRISGNISLEEALQRLSRDGSEAGPVARRHLARLGG